MTSSVGSDVVEAAHAAASAAARSAVTIRSATTLAEVQLARQVVEDVWHPPADDPAVTESLLWPLVHVGNYCAIAYDASDPDQADAEHVGQPIGVCIGFLGLEPSYCLHSHAAGVTRAGAGRNIGFALKQDQRAWALDRGIATISWTYDPLVRRNAFFNIARLGGRPLAYLVDFYGEMTDGINVGQGSDRLTLTWDLLSPETIRYAVRDYPEPPTQRDRDTWPDNEVRFLQVPPDIERMRDEDPAQAREWRRSLRASLGGLMADGWSVVSMSRDGYYELRRQA